ncbi:repressor LexA [Candidatus Erwinia dacicola]|nr:transcriptional repressor LexA [Candidatus Erwinia dacicola]NJD00278.1 repressor LexA [Candidatus Erwinia dacicola]
MKALTARQQQVYDLIRDHINQTGMPPTRAEIATQLGFRSPNAAEEHLKALARKGVIEIVSGASRGIRLIIEEEDGLPLIGRVAAGEPVQLLPENPEFQPIVVNLRSQTLTIEGLVVGVIRNGNWL